MHLRRLVVKGFKSFADRTVIDLSPGISIVVGPNGSGKSNIVDAIAWVLGERGPRALRGGTMEDVIFAGTPQRQALGRAEVELTIDNTDGALAIDYSEVTFRRTLFRTGESEYAINGTSCRLLDITELLSDSGIGRELHTLIGQGHLEDILAGSPMDRRAVIEDAAGLLKHRKRKEKAMRKLERVDADLERLGDVLGELKRQIRPLERQAELAKRADAITAELTEARLRLWVLDHRAVTSEDDATSLAHALEEVRTSSAELERIEAGILEAEAALELARRDAESLLSIELRLQGMLERFRSLATLAAERSRRLADRAARAPSDSAPDAESIAEAAAAADSAARAASDAAEAHRLVVARRDAAREEADRIARAIQEIRRLEAERDARRTALARAADEISGLDEPRQHATTEASIAERDASDARRRIVAVEAKENELAGRSDELDARLRDARAEVDRAEAEERDAERTLAAMEARRGVLAEEIERQRDPAAFAATLGVVRGRVLDSLEVEPGYEAAVFAALGALTEAVLVESLADAAEVIEAWREAQLHGSMVVAEALPIGEPLATGSVAAHVRARTNEGVKLAAHLATVALVEDLATASALLEDDADRIVVTTAGDRIDRGVVSGGARIATRDLAAEVRVLETEVEQQTTLRDRCADAVSSSRDAATAAEAEVATADRQLNELDAERESLLARLEEANRTSEQATADLRRAGEREADLRGQIAIEEARLTELDRLLAGAQLDGAPAQDELAVLEAEVAEAARVLGESTERERGVREQHAGLVARAERVQREQVAYERGRDAWERGASKCATVADEARTTCSSIERWVADAAEARDGGESRRVALVEWVAELRARRRDVDARLADARERAHGAELRASDRRHRLEALEAACRERLGMEPHEALEAVNPDESERADLESKAKGMERKLGLLGRVNPIAMEQHEELLERHRFLQEQTDDLRTARRELLGVVTEVDKTITGIFAAAFTDVAREFEIVFERLFPGGEGRLSLVDPEDLLDTGVEVEARPAGKRVKRVSLLSGGERSLVALALLFAVFRSRPSPFYILDEVEAALDDVNLDRVLKVLRDFGKTSQLLVISHQKRTMEIADILYGISMQEAGVTQVLSERLDRIPESV